MSGEKYFLTEEVALEIRRVYHEETCAWSTLAARFGVSTGVVSRVIRGEHSSVRSLPDITRGDYRTSWNRGGAWWSR